MSESLKTPKELALEIGITPKALRSIMRQLAEETPGSGGRWAIDADFEATIRERLSRSHHRNVVIGKAKVKAD